MNNIGKYLISVFCGLVLSITSIAQTVAIPNTLSVSAPVSVPVLTHAILPFSPLFSPGINTQIKFVTNTNGAIPNLTNMTVGVIQYQGENAIFNVTAISSNTVTYQWYKSNGDTIVGATKSSMTLSNVQPTDAGWYYVSAVNSHGQSVAATTLCVIYTNILTQCLPTNTVILTFAWTYDFIDNTNTDGFYLYQGTASGQYTKLIAINADVTNVNNISIPMDSNKYYFTLTAKDINNIQSTNTPELVFFSPLPTLTQFNLSVLMLETGNPKIQMQVCPFQTITLQYSTNLISWAPMKTLIADKYGNVLWDDLDPKRTTFRFYRVTTQ